MIETKTTTWPDGWFLNGTKASLDTYNQAMQAAHTIIRDRFANLDKPFSGISVQELTSLFHEVEICPEEGNDVRTVLRQTGDWVLRHSVAVHHPACAAHLHCPPLTPALAAEAMISAMNQSMDSWDQSPAATVLEEEMVRWLCRLFGFGSGSDGVFTSGGTQSNFMGLLVARNHFAHTRFGWDIQSKGLPPTAKDWRILCSEAAHFTVKQSAALLGLGEEAVVSVETDESHRLAIHDLDRKLAQLRREKRHPFAIVATAGTTDFGSIDPLPELAARTRREGIWLHVDAAYGGALALSRHHRQRLTAIESADSITVDFHKWFYQPISCGAFLLQDASRFIGIKQNADYLNPTEDEQHGIPHLVAKSVQTTRRFDALKLFVSLQTLGRSGFSRMIDHTAEIAREAAAMIGNDEKLQSINPNPTLNAVVFRYIPDPCADECPQARQNRINRDIRHILLASGEAVIAQTKVKGDVCLKLTLLNPRISLTDIHRILDSIKRIGAQLENERGACTPHVANTGPASYHAKLF